MDPISTIITDSIAKLHTVVTDVSGPMLRSAADAAGTVIDAVSPTCSALVAGVSAMEAFCGPQLFTALVVVGGGFVALAVGSTMAHRYP